MNVVLFLGTKIGYTGLKTLIDLGANIKQVFVDKEHVHEIEKYDQSIIDLCKKNDIKVYEGANHSDIDRATDQENIDYIFCFGFRRLIKETVLKKAKYAACSTHFSLLPKYRGFAPVNWAIINGEDKCGVSLFHMEKEADCGDIVAQRQIAIGQNEYVESVMNSCIDTFQSILNEVWPELIKGNVTRIVQDDSIATYTCARNPEDGEINWNETMQVIYNLIRGTSKPFPGAFTKYKNDKMTIWKAEPYEVGHYVGRIPGKVIQVIKDEGIVVLTGDGALLIQEVEMERDTEVKCPDQVIKSVRVTLGS